MARSVKRNSKRNSNSNKNLNRSKNRSQRRNKNRSQRRNKNRSQRRNKNSNKNKNKKMKGGALPSYRLHQEMGYLNRVNPNAHSLPLTYKGNHVVENHSNQYSLSH